MSVTTYTIGCGYELSKLKNTVYFLSKDSLKTISIDNGEAYATFVNQSPQPPSPNRLKGFNVKLTESESLDERYKFTKQLTMSIHGHLIDSRFLMDDDYYIVVQTEDGTYYLVNVDFPSKMTYTYNLSNGQNQTDFTFTSNSNHPTLKLNWNLVTWNTCQTYQVFGIDGLKLLEKDYTTIDAEQGVINLFDGYEFKDVDFLKNTISLQEAYDGELTTTTISFEIAFNNYKPSWQYNLLEFDKNLYAAHITPKNSTSGIFAGYEHGLQPQYELNGSATVGDSTSIKITLTEASNWGIFEFDTWSYYRDSSKRWVGIDSEVKCISLGVGINTLMQEVDGNGTPTGRYKCLEGYESEYTNYNIIGTYTEDEVESFRTSVCTRFRTRSGGSSGEYTCINGNKYELLTTQISYGNDNWLNVGDEYIIGELVESASSWCEAEVQTKWVLNRDKSTCRIDDYENEYLTFIPLENGNFGFKPMSADTTERDISANTYSYSTDSGQTWTTLRAGQHTGTIIKGHKVMWKWSGSGSLVFSQIGMCQFESSGRFNVEGNVMSMIYGDDFRGRKSLRGTQSTFRYLFHTCSKLISAKNLILPATELVYMCYGDMFWYCSGLTTPPQLPATELESHCYLGMFMGCTSLSSAPVLPSTKLADFCYRSMFRGCTSLRTAPELLATELARGCYYYMFESCTRLSNNVVLPALKLVNNCYTRMFYGCSSLTAVTCYAVDIAADESTMWWMNGVPSGGTFIKNSFMTNWSIDDSNAIPTTWTIEEELPEDMEYQVVSTLLACEGVDKVSEAVYELKYPSDTTSCYVTTGGTVVESCYNGCGCRTPSTLLPSDYTELLYVENANQACVDLGLQLFNTANSSFSISARVQTDANQPSDWTGEYNGIITNGYITNYSPCFRYGWVNNETDRELVFESNVNATFSSIPDLTSAITISCSDTSSQRSASELLLFALHNGNSYGVKPYFFGVGKIYTMTVTFNGSVVRDLIPCKRNSDNEVGLYDTVNNVFYTAMYHDNQSWHLVGGPVLT